MGIIFSCCCKKNSSTLEIEQAQNLTENESDQPQNLNLNDSESVSSDDFVFDEDFHRRFSAIFREMTNPQIENNEFPIYNIFEVFPTEDIFED